MAPGKHRPAVQLQARQFENKTRLILSAGKRIEFAKGLLAELWLREGRALICAKRLALCAWLQRKCHDLERLSYFQIPN